MKSQTPEEVLAMFPQLSVSRVHRENEPVAIPTLRDESGDLRPLLSATVNINLVNGNDGRGVHWSKSHKRRKDYEAMLRNPGLCRKPLAFTVRLVITRILGIGQRLWDADSVGRGGAKELVDSLVAIGWFYDDGPKWISATDFRQDDGQRENGPAVMIEVFPSERR